MKEKKADYHLHADQSVQNHFTAYLSKALKNSRQHYINKQAKLEIVDLVEDPENILDTHQSKEDLTVDMFDRRYAEEMDAIEDMSLLFALRQLNDKDRTIIRLHVIYGYSYREVANMLGMTPTSVSTRYSRAIAQIRQRMEASK